MADFTEPHRGASPSPPLLAAVELARRDGDQVLLTGVSLEIHARDRVAVVGATGSGKSLLLRALAFLDPIDSGKLLWQGREIHGPEAPRFRGCVMYLHQRPALIEGSVEEILRQPFGLRLHRDKVFDRAAIIARLALVGRGESFLESQQRDLSGGEAQIVALLRAMQLAPHVLLLDEPTAALDAQSTAAVESLIETYLSEQPTQRAAVWVTHDRAQAQRVASRWMQMRAGVLSEGS